MPSFQVGQVVNRVDRVRGVSAGWSEKLSGDYSRVPRDANHPKTVSTSSPNSARNVRAVSVAVGCVEYGIIAIIKVPTVYIIDISIAIIIKAIDGIEWINPYISREVWMIYLHSLIDYSHVHIV
jgi:hypothetical protein